MSNEESCVVALEGLIGAGKTTLMDNLRWTLRNKNVPFTVGFIREPADLFNRYGTMTGCWHAPLELMYKDPIQNLPMAQMHIVRESSSWYKSLIKSQRNQGFDFIITERSIESPPIFIEAAYAAGHLSCFSRDFLLDEWRSLFDLYFAPNAIFYLDVGVDSCLDRIAERTTKSGHEPFRPGIERFLEKSYLQYLDFVNPKTFILESEFQSTCDQVDDVIKLLTELYNKSKIPPTPSTVNIFGHHDNASLL